MFIDRCAHDLKTHRYKPLLAPGIALTLIYCYLEYLSRDPYFWLTRVLPFCLQSFFPGFCFSCLRGCWFWMRYTPQKPTSSTAIWKTRSVPPRISICSRWRVSPARLALLSAYADHGHLWNFPYLFPIMVTGWLAMQACSKMVTGSADLKD